MKNRIWTDALREVRGTLGRFLSLLLLSALAVAFLAGLRTTAPNMERSADRYYDAQGLMDLRVISTLGLTQEDISALGGQLGIAAAEGAYTVDAIVSGTDNDFIVKALSISEAGINRPRLVEGRLPEQMGECLVEPRLMQQMGLSLGDTIALDTGTDSFGDALKQNSFTVVGTADSPLYISTDRGSSSLGSGRVTAFLLLPRSAFQMETYTDAYLLAQGAAGLLCYGTEYEDLMETLTDRLEPLGTARERNRYDQVVGEANEKLDEAQSEFDNAQAEAEEKLTEAREKLADARWELDQGWSDYTDGKATYEREIAAAEKKIAQAETVDLPDALRTLEEGEADYAEGSKKLQDAWADYEEGLKDYQAGLEEYQEGYDELITQDETYNEALKKLQDGEVAYAAGFQKYGRGLDQLQDGGKQIQENEKKLSDALDQLFDGQQALSAGQVELGGIQEAHTQLSGAYGALMGRLAADGLAAPDPAAMGAKLGAAIGQELMTTGRADGFYGSYVAPLAGLLEAERELVAQAGQSTAQLDGVLAALPAHGGDFGPNAVTSYLTGLGAAQAVLQRIDGQLGAAGGALDAAAGDLSWGEMEYETGKEQLTKAKETFYASVAELKEAGKTLADSRKELDDGWQTLRDGETELDQGWATLNTARTELNDAQATLDDAWQQLQDAQQELIDARQELDDGWAEYQRGLADLDEAKATLAEEKPKGARDLADALRKLEEGEVEYSDGLREYEEAKAEADEKLSDARRELNNAQRKIAEIDDCKWYFLGRGTNMGYVSFQNDAQRMGQLASVFPLIFFLVAALVCLTTMTRMVEEHRVQIGGLKALGYGPGAISVKYVGYGLAASLGGGLLGLGFGCTVIPIIIYSAWAIIYTLGPLEIPFYPGVSLLSVGAAVLTVVGAAFLTCRSALTEVPAALMRPKAPKSGKRVLLERVGFLWRRLSFSHKVTVRNLFRYKRRFWMTVVGIGGCTALIVTGFGLRDAIFTIMDKQYDELFRYTSQIGLVDDMTDDERTELYRALDKSVEVAEYRGARQESLLVEGNGQSVDAALFTAGAAGFGDFITLQGRLDQAPVALPDEGAVLTEKLAKLLDVKVGDQVTLDGEERVSVTVTGITEHYIGHYVYLSAGAYEALYRTPPKENLILARYTEDSRAVSDAVSGRLIPLAGVTSVGRITDTRQTYQHSMESVDYAVVVVIISAAALAFVVLFNLTNINITERLRELATLKVLGFYDGELAAYVFRENALLTVFGVLLGLVMGKFLHQWLVLTVEIDMLMFYREAKPLSYVFAVALTALFSITVNLVAGRKLKKINMVESLKTVE